jgi:hypothetical protein
MDDDNHEHHYRDREMEIEPRLEEVLETHLRDHAVFQVTFLRGEPCDALERTMFCFWNMLEITPECLNLRRHGRRGSALTPQEPPPHVVLGDTILDLSLAGVGKFLGLISGQSTHLSDNFPQFIIRAMPQGVGEFFPKCLETSREQEIQGRAYDTAHHDNG